MWTAEELMEVLKTEFGISSMEQFIEEFEKLEPIDITVFCTPVELGDSDRCER